MSITLPPSAPNRTNPSVFSQRMDDFLAWLVTAVPEFNALAIAAEGFTVVSGTTEFDFAAGVNRKFTPTATATLTTTVPPSGTLCHLILTTSGTTSYTLTFGSGFTTTGTRTTGTVSGKVYALTFVSDGTTLIETSRTAAM